MKSLLPISVPISAKYACALVAALLLLSRLPVSAAVSTPAPVRAALSIPKPIIPPATAASNRPFRIGYLPEKGEGGLEPDVAHRLAQWLASQRDVRSALHGAGYSGEISFQPADGHNDLKNNLDNAQFDLAFCPAAVFVTLKPGYHVILQEKRKGDTWDSRAGGQILRQGVIFVGPSSPLFSSDRITTQSLVRLLAKNDLAVPSAYDAAGYQYPLLALANQMHIAPGSLHLRFCGSSEEVVKQVVSGLAAIGACDRSVLENWLPEALPAALVHSAENRPLGQVVRYINIDIPPVPTDPVIIRADLQPETSPLGRVLKEDLPKFFREQGDKPFALEGRARDEYYDRLNADLAYLDSLTGAGQPPSAGEKQPSSAEVSR